MAFIDRETKETRAAEWRFANRLAEKWDSEAHHLSSFYWMDFMFYRHKKVVAFLELKVRTNRHDAYPTYMISLMKFMHGKQLEIETGIPFLIAVRFTNCDMYYHVKPGDKCTVEIGGRRDRNWSDDIEPVAMIPMSRFKFVAE